jgi:hypothetical protein
MQKPHGDDGTANLKVLPGFGPVRDEGSVKPAPEGKHEGRWWEAQQS